MPLYAFDGTWNDSRDPGRDTTADTNVYRFCQHYDPQQPVHYVDGVGSRRGYIGRWLGGASGFGSRTRVAEGFAALKKNFSHGNTSIDVIGYSRGATIARMFVHRIANEFYRLRDHNDRPLTQPPEVRFLGLFDTVASLGLPWTKSERGFNPHIPEFVQRAYHAMALDEIRQTFGLERCIGLRENICEVWFRGGHADIGGNSSYYSVYGEVLANRARADVALNWMLHKARACQLPIVDTTSHAIDPRAAVTSKPELISIGDAGTQSRRIHFGDLVHHSVDCVLDTQSLHGELLRRIDVTTRIEDPLLERSRDITHWRALTQPPAKPPTADSPHLIELSSRRYPFDVSPARRWLCWLHKWDLPSDDFAARLNEFWAPTAADRALAWDIYVELQTRISTQKLGASGDEQTALDSIVSLFGTARTQIRQHGVAAANAATVLNHYLNTEIRPFTTHWHPHALAGRLKADRDDNLCRPFRAQLEDLRPRLSMLAAIMSELADASICGDRPTPADSANG